MKAKLSFYKQNKSLSDKHMKRDSESAYVHMKRDTLLPLHAFVNILDGLPPFI